MLTKIKQIKKGYVMVAAAALAVGSLSTAALAVGTARNGSGTLARFDAVEISHPQDAYDPVCTQSTDWTDIPGLSKTFQQGGLLGSSATMVTFNGQFAASQTGWDSWVHVRLLVDDVAQGGSGADESLYETQIVPHPNTGWTFFTDPLASGNHTAKLQWKIVPPVGSEEPQFCLQNRSMVVLHR